MKSALLTALAAGVLSAAVPSARASVQVYGEATSTGPTVRVEVFADITAPAIVSHSFKLFYPSRELTLESVTRNDAVWSFHDGTRAIPYSGPETGNSGEVMFVGGHLDARDPLAGVLGNHVLLGTVVFNRRSSDTPSFDLSIGRSGQFASFVTVGGAVLEAQPGFVNWQAIGNDPNDRDLDGLNDKWEEKYFGTTKGVFYSDDLDKDGVSNLGEEAMGTDPTDPRSLLRLEIVNGKETMRLEWPSVEGRVYTVEGAKSLGRFEVLNEGIAATPPLNSVEFKRGEFGETLFFRVRVAPDLRR